MLVCTAATAGHNRRHEFCFAFLFYTVSQKVPTFKLSVTLSNLNRFSYFCTAGKHINLLQNPYDITHLTIGMWLHYLGKFSADIQQTWKKMQRNCIFIAFNFVIHPQILIFSVFKIAIFPMLIANKIFHVTVLLLVYVCNQFLALEIRHNSVCQQST